MNARQLVDAGTTRLEAAGVAEAKTKAEWWISESLGISRDALDSIFPDGSQTDQIECGLQRLERHEPLQHVIGNTPFLDLSLATDARALVPRPETEELVMRVLGCAALWSRREVTLADVGTGTGCIAIAIASKRTAARVTAIDISSKALELARHNAVTAGVGDRIQFIEGDLLSGITPTSLDVVVSNPPYIARQTLASLDESVRNFEPTLALDGGTDGLDIIRRLILQAFTSLKNDGRIWLEIGDDQGDAVRDLLIAAGFQNVEINRDMYGQVRFAEAIKS